MSKVFNPFGLEQPVPPYNEEWAARRPVAALLRTLSEQVITRNANVEQLAVLEEQLKAAVNTLVKCDKLEGRTAWVNDSGDHGQMGVLSREITPMAGNSNAMAPPMLMWIDGDTAHGRVTAGWLFEGPPNCVHGGIIAALFDEFMGCSQLISGKAGATGHLTIRYHQPTPIGVELQMTAKIVSVSGRKIVVEADMRANDIVTATAEGLFISFHEGVTNLATRNTAEKSG